MSTAADHYTALRWLVHWAVDGWGFTFGTARRCLGELRPNPVPSSLYQNLIAHPSTTSVPTSYYSMCHYNNLCLSKGFNFCILVTSCYVAVKHHLSHVVHFWHFSLLLLLFAPLLVMYELLIFWLFNIFAYCLHIRQNMPKKVERML